MNTSPIIATRINNWYHVPTAELTEDLLEYFAGKAERSPLYCKFTDDSVCWTTQFEWADKLEITAAYSSKGMLCLNTTPVETQEERRQRVLELKSKFKKSAVVTKAPADIIVTDSDL
jgi:hypothetical protein